MNTELCDDHHVCRNGSRCVPHPNYSGKFTCECSVDGTDIVYAGLSCDHAATSYCNEQNVPDAVAFCTNGGECLGNSSEGEQFMGCKCPTGYKGNHCELTQGQSVPDYVSPPSLRSSGGGGGGGGNTAVVASVSAIMAVLVMGALVAGYVIAKRRRNGAIHSVASPKSIREADSTQLEADGEILKNSFRATVTADNSLYSPGSTLSQTSSSHRKPLDPEVDVTEGIECEEDSHP